MRGRKRLHHEVCLEGARRVSDFLAATRDDGRLGTVRDLIKTKLASQAAQEATCQSSDGDSGKMLFSCEHAGQAMVIGNFCSFSFHVGFMSDRSHFPERRHLVQEITLAQTPRSATCRMEVGYP